MPGRTLATRHAGPGATAQNRSLERGLDVLRSFRQGVDHLGNGEISERTGLSPSTVSRLTQSLVACGMLEYDSQRRIYRLAPPILSLAHAMRIGSPVLQTALPLMRAVAEQHRVNVGLAAPDRESMVYIESVRHHRKRSLRQVVAGMRVPMDVTALGRAYLAALSPVQRMKTLALLERHRGSNWPRIGREIESATVNVGRYGFCAAAWQPGAIAVATPLPVSATTIYALNVSVASDEQIQAVARALKGPLLDLRTRIVDVLGITDLATT